MKLFKMTQLKQFVDEINKFIQDKNNVSIETLSDLNNILIVYWEE